MLKPMSLLKEYRQIPKYVLFRLMTLGMRLSQDTDILIMRFASGIARL